MNSFKLIALIVCTSYCKICFTQSTNVALNKPVFVSGSAAAYPASNITDGKITRTSAWKSASSTAPHIVEIDLKKYYSINSIKVHSGILDEEKNADEKVQAAGFWSVKNFKLQYWDDANWSDFPKSEVHENRLANAEFNYNPSVTTFKIRLVCDDGEAISLMEIEAFGKETPGMPEPPSINSSVQPQLSTSAPKSAVVKVNNIITGKSLKYVGYNQGYYMPNSNVSGWVEYSNVNSFRVWTSLNPFVPEAAVEVDKNLSSVEEFDKRKAALRESPEKNDFIKWQMLLPIYDAPDSSSTNAMVFSYALSELKRLKVDVVLQTSSTDFENNWGNKWKQWQRYYALAFYAAKAGDVRMFAMQNEPNHRNSGPMKLDTWIMGMQIVSDAVHCAVEDVNKIYSKNLVPKFVGPVTAGQNTDWWANISKLIRTDYHGNKIDKDLIEIFSTHSYNSPAVGYESRIKNIEDIMEENHPLKKKLPIAYTEIGRWMNAYLIDKEETMDSPSLFTEWAGMYANNMKNGGYGMWAFKFANTASNPYPRGIKSGHHFIWQGKRIVENAYKNIALNKSVTTSGNKLNAKKINDGDKTDASFWLSDTSSKTKWVEINLQQKMDIGSAVIYTGSNTGIYTAPDRVKNIKLQYFADRVWKDIAGTTEKDNKYAQVFDVFSKPVNTDRIRFVSTDEAAIKVREIKLFAVGDGPSNEPNYDVSGIQRTGEVVRLFAKGFKEERPLFQTQNATGDNGLDTYTSYDAETGNYYMWLVQRGMFTYNLQIDLSNLEVKPGAVISAETVNNNFYGEVTDIKNLPNNKIFSMALPSQSVMLLTISPYTNIKKTISVSQTATVSPGSSTTEKNTAKNEMVVQLNAAIPSKNKVAYSWFNTNNIDTSVQKFLLKVNGYTNKKESPFRIHVYAIPSQKWDEKNVNGQNALLLDGKEALIKEIGTQAFVAGEIAFTNKKENHYLDITSVIKKHNKNEGITFVFVRETRQLGDDEDSNYSLFIGDKNNKEKSEIIFWERK